MALKNKKSVSQRIKITKSGKIMRRAMSLGHNRANKAGIQMGRKKRKRLLSIHSYAVKKYF
ncbi:MAG: hypothetical protein QMD50_03455 [Patescibacteria group bacterium]|nr:hypothetical protein [Patescibacteria group bacterium]